MLREAIAAALAGEGGFRLVVQGRAAPPPARTGVDEGGRCAVLWPMENSAAAIWQLLAALDAGIVPLLLPPHPPPARLAALRARFPGFGVREGAAIAWPAAPVQAAPELGFGLLTSGSTGEPKAIVTSLARLECGVRAIHAAQGLEGAHATGVLLPLAYSYACVNQLFWAVLHGRALHLPGPLADMGTCLAHLRSERVDMLCLVAHQAGALARLGEAAAALPDVRWVNFAGAPFPVADFGALRRLFPAARLLNNYGCAEAMPRIACVEVAAPDASLSLVGHPVGAIALRIGGGAPAGPIEFRGPSTALGTIGADGALQPFGDWIASGDQGRMAEEGLYVLGRHDQVVKVGGERLSLLELEQALLGFGAQQALAWIEAGERVVAVIHMDHLPTLAQLLPCLRAQLPRALLPAAIHVAAQWPRNANGKTDRPALQALAGSGALQQIWPATP